MKALTYDDIQLIPEYSEVESRQNVSLTSAITMNYSLDIPIVAAPMPTVCGYEMALALNKLGAVGCIHRFMSIEEQVDAVSKLQLGRLQAWSLPNGARSNHLPVMAAVGVNGDYLERAQALYDHGASIILIDVAHGHHSLVKTAIHQIKRVTDADVIAGNIATVEAALDLQDWGADALRVGIGGGSLCTTRIKTGFGVPNVTCIEKIAEKVSIPIIADGGIRSTGDMAKALALGASSVMLGSMLAGTYESPGAIINKPTGLYKKYSGAASFDTKVTHGQAVRNIEGESTVIPYKGSVDIVIAEIVDSLKSAFSYAGAINIISYKPKYVKVTHAGMIEAKPHLI